MFFSQLRLIINIDAGWYHQGKDAAFTPLAFDRDLSAHKLSQLFGNGQSQARAAEIAGGAAIGLSKRLEDGVEFVLGDADADGDFVTVVFTGPAGSTMDIIKPSDSGSDIARLVLNGTDFNSSLIVTTKGKGSETTISEIIVNGSLKSLSAKTTDISNSIVLSGCISSITLDDIAENASITTGSETSTGFALKADNLADDVVFDLAGLVKSFQVNTYAGGSLTADSIKTIKVKDDKVENEEGKVNFGANVTSKSGEIQSLFAYGDITGRIEAATYIKSVTSKTGSLSSDAAITANGDINNANFGGDVAGQIISAGRINRLASRHGTLSGEVRSLDNIGTIYFNDIDNATISSFSDIEKVLSRSNITGSYLFAGYDMFGIDGQLNTGDELNPAGATIKSVKTSSKGNFDGSFALSGLQPYDYNPETGSWVILAPEGETQNTASFGRIINARLGQVWEGDPADPYGLFAATTIDKVKVTEVTMGANAPDFQPKSWL